MAAKDLADTAQGDATQGISDASDAQSDATQAISDASDAQADANTAQGLLDNIALDTKITPVEKLTLKPIWDAIVIEGTATTGTIPVQAIAVGVADTDFDTAYAALYAYIITSLNVFGTMTSTTDITRSTWDTAWKNYYDERTKLLIAINDAIKSLADDAQDTVDGLFATSITIQAGGSISAGDVTIDDDGITIDGTSSFIVEKDALLTFNIDDVAEFYMKSFDGTTDALGIYPRVDATNQFFLGFSGNSFSNVDIYTDRLQQSGSGYTLISNSNGFAYTSSTHSNGFSYDSTVDILYLDGSINPQTASANCGTVSVPWGNVHTTALNLGGNILLVTDNHSDIGTAAKSIKNIYANNLYSPVITSTAAILLDAVTNITLDAEDDVIIDCGTSDEVLFKTNGTTSLRIDKDTVYPENDSAVDIGKSDKYIKNIYADKYYLLSTTDYIESKDYTGVQWMDFYVNSNYGFAISETGKIWTDSNADINGDCDISGALSKGSGTFLIDHPLDPTNKLLQYGFTESPKYDLIHRGITTLLNGSAVIDIDSEYDFSPGTFEALCKNAQVTSLLTINSFERVKASLVSGSIFTIESESKIFNGDVSWVVIAERKDAHIIYDNKTDSNGSLINEIDKESMTPGKLDNVIKEPTDGKEDGTEDIVTVKMKNEKGYYRHPEAFGQTHPTKKIKYIRAKEK